MYCKIKGVIALIVTFRFAKNWKKNPENLDSALTLRVRYNNKLPR